MLSQFRSFWPGSSSAPASSTATTVPAASAIESCPAAVMPTTSVVAASSATERRLTRLRRAAAPSCVSLLWVSVVSLFGNIHPLLVGPRAVRTADALITALIVWTLSCRPPTHRCCLLCRSGGSAATTRLGTTTRPDGGSHRALSGRCCGNAQLEHIGRRGERRDDTAGGADGFRGGVGPEAARAALRRPGARRSAGPAGAGPRGRRPAGLLVPHARTTRSC